MDKAMANKLTAECKKLLEIYLFMKAQGLAHAEIIWLLDNSGSLPVKKKH